MSFPIKAGVGYVQWYVCNEKSNHMLAHIAEEEGEEEARCVIRKPSYSVVVGLLPGASFTVIRMTSVALNTNGMPLLPTDIAHVKGRGRAAAG